MHSYFGSDCPYCGNPFTEDDDIVVCPECGTPHHRDCYKEHAACANEAQHSENFEWKNAFAPAAPVNERSGEGAPLVCGNCGNENPANSHFCLACGAPLAEAKRTDKKRPTYEEFQRERERMLAESFHADLGGISAKEAAIFVRTNIGYFLPRFAAFNKGTKFDTNFSAFIFSYLYLFYRKMYGLGIAVFAATMILSIPTMLLDLAMIQEQYVEMGLLSQVIWHIPHQETLAIYSIIANIFVWGIRIALMMFFNKLYFAKVVNTIKGARETLATKGETEIAAFFRKKGGTGLFIPIAVCCLAFLASFVLAFFIVSSEFFIVPEMANFL